MPKYNALVIYDRDGTIVDSQAQIVQCMREAFVSRKLESLDRSAIRLIVGLILDGAIARLAPELDESQRMAAIGTYGMHDEAQLLQYRPDYLIYNIAEIENLIIRNQYV